MNLEARKGLQEWVNETDDRTVATAIGVSIFQLYRYLGGGSKPQKNTLEKIEAKLAERNGQDAAHDGQEEV